ncbi:uncharacterized protein N7511_006042 [Penicillium nucicola]|uniref:uncharacterized protein n=1 Tax=Penicillium nucicola TaxID=1850975 RepID=UPI0025459B96|nr:uncharacterized protein N7511_006042 [Penicillium nucicola]KAJ5757348.1 hypothetical protein N7511_006042 [Penicillium nucicola]
MSMMARSFINQPSGRAVTRSFNLPWSSGDDFRLSLIPISAGDRGSIPRGRACFLLFTTGSVAASPKKKSVAPYNTTGPVHSTRPAGPMARRLTTNQEIAGSTPASVNYILLFEAVNGVCGGREALIILHRSGGRGA